MTNYKYTKIITIVWRQHILASNNCAVISPVGKCLILFKVLSFCLKEKLFINYKDVIMKYLILLKPQSPLEFYILGYVAKRILSQVQIFMGLLNILVFLSFSIVGIPVEFKNKQFWYTFLIGKNII